MNNVLGIYSIQDIKTSYIGLTTGYGDDDASDYRVVRLGSFDLETGVITPLLSPRVLAEGGQIVSSFRKESDNEDNK